MSTEEHQESTQETTLSEEAKEQRADIEAVKEAYRIFINGFRELERNLRKASRSATIEEAALREKEALQIIEKLDDALVNTYPKVHEDLINRVHARAEHSSPKRVPVPIDDEDNNGDNGNEDHV